MTIKKIMAIIKSNENGERITLKMFCGGVELKDKIEIKTIQVNGEKIHKIENGDELILIKEQNGEAVVKILNNYYSINNYKKVVKYYANNFSAIYSITIAE